MEIRDERELGKLENYKRPGDYKTEGTQIC